MMHRSPTTMYGREKKPYSPQHVWLHYLKPICLSCYMLHLFPLFPPRKRDHSNVFHGRHLWIQHYPFPYFSRGNNLSLSLFMTIMTLNIFYPRLASTFIVSTIVPRLTPAMLLVLATTNLIHIICISTIDAIIYFPRISSLNRAPHISLQTNFPYDALLLTTMQNVSYGASKVHKRKALLFLSLQLGPQW